MVTVTGHATLDGTPLTATAELTLQVATPATLLGCSASSNDHGGTEVWDGWRCYTKASRDTLANRTGSQRPKFLAYSETGSNPTGSYSTIYTAALADFNAFYYGGTGQTRSSRWGIRLYRSAGNENHDKGSLALPHTQAGIDAYATCMRALWDAAHVIDATTGQRRFPDAYVGSNPTTEAERSGWVEDWLHPTAQWHDFVMWSIYPAGRKDTEADPTFNWPSTNPADWAAAPDGYMVRCFRRVAAAAAVGGHPIALGVGETGSGDDPGDSTTRPYWAVHGFMHPLLTLAAQYGMEVPFVCWWDNQVDAGSPQNILSDEPVSTSPSTRTAWQNHLSFNHLRGGAHPSSWAGNPKADWKTTGTVV